MGELVAPELKTFMHRVQVMFYLHFNYLHNFSKSTPQHYIYDGLLMRKASATAAKSSYNFFAKKNKVCNECIEA